MNAAMDCRPAFAIALIANAADIRKPLRRSRIDNTLLTSLEPKGRPRFRRQFPDSQHTGIGLQPSQGRPLSESMDEKTLTAVSTTLALMQIQVNALLLLLERQAPSESIREDFQRLISEGVQTVGVETMEGIKERIREGIAASRTTHG